MGELSDAIPFDPGAGSEHASHDEGRDATRAEAGGLKPASGDARERLARIGAVLKTYPVRWRFRVCAALVLAYLALALTIPRDINGRTWMLLVQLTTVETVCAATLTEHAKEQLLDARATVTPNFRMPHLLVWFGLMLFVLLLLPMASAGLIGRDDKGGFLVQALNALGAAAFAGLWAMALAWCAHFASIWTMVPLAGLFSLLASEAVLAQTLDMLTGRAPMTAAGLLIVVLALLALLAWRLMSADEHSPDWRRAMTNWGLRAAMTGDPSLAAPAEAPGREGGPLATASSQFDWLLRHTGRSLQREAPGALFAGHWWWRVRHYRMVTGLGWRPMALGAVIMLVLMILVTLVALNSNHSQATLFGGFATLGMCATVLPGIIVAFYWPRRWLTISYEAMLPSTRRRFLLESGAAMFIDQLVLWLTCQLFVAAGLAAVVLMASRTTDVLPPGAQMSATRPPINFSVLWVLTALPLPQLLIFGIITAAMWVRSALLSFLIIFPIAILPFIVVQIAQALTSGRWDDDGMNVLLAYALAATPSILSIAFSYWLWRDADFE